MSFCEMNDGFSSMLGVEDKGALAGRGHSGEKSLAPQSSLGRCGVWVQAFSVQVA